MSTEPQFDYEIGGGQGLGEKNQEVGSKWAQKQDGVIERKWES